MSRLQSPRVGLCSWKKKLEYNICIYVVSFVVSFINDRQTTLFSDVVLSASKSLGTLRYVTLKLEKHIEPPLRKKEKKKKRKKKEKRREVFEGGGASNGTFLLFLLGL
jgi:hypothetical protein